MRILAFLLVFGFCQAQLSVANPYEGIITGEGFYSLRFIGGGIQLQTSNDQAFTLSSALERTFTFEAWAMLPGPANDGKYKTMIARWQRGPNGFHNRWADFDFQVQASGDINFFMGNGALSDYGILLSPGRTLTPGKWHHLGFKIETLPGELNPARSTVFVDDEEFVREGWITGQRQELPNQPIWMGTFFNQDGDFKIWDGYMDEIRFWNDARSLEQFVASSQRGISSDTPGLLAYYRLNDGGGHVVRAEDRPQFDARIDNTGTETSAQWRVSGVKIHTQFDEIGPASLKLLRLPGVEPPPGGQLTFFYWISSLPVNGTLLADGQIITRTPFRLASNSVVYQAPNILSITDQFTYYGTDRTGERESSGDTIVFLQVGARECDRDRCGQCDGENTECTCQPLPYNGLSIADIERLLLLFEIEQVMDLLVKLEGKFDTLLHELQTAVGPDIAVYVNDFLDFNRECLMAFCNRLDPFMDRLAAIGP